MQEIDFSGYNNVSFNVKDAGFKKGNRISVISFIGDAPIPLITTYSEQQFLDLYYKMQEVVVDLEGIQDEK